jgi:hypothetical protein
LFFLLGFEAIRGTCTLQFLGCPLPCWLSFHVCLFYGNKKGAENVSFRPFLIHKYIIFCDVFSFESV